MARFDLERTPSPEAQERAEESYGHHLDDPRYLYFAILVAAGEPLYKAYGALFPDASEGTCRTQSSILAAHPEVREMMVTAGLPAQKLAQGLAPKAMQALARNLQDEKPAVRQKAADSILDRGGVPRKSQAEHSIRADIQASGVALLELAAQLEPPAARPRADRSPKIDDRESEDETLARRRREFEASARDRAARDRRSFNPIVGGDDTAPDRH